MKKKNIMIIGMIAALLVVVILALVLWKTSYREKGKTTDTWSNEFKDHDEKMAFLAKYLIMPSEPINAEYHIVYQDNSIGSVPGPSDWDVRVILKISPEDFGVWLDGYKPVTSSEIDLTWWDGLASDNITWEGHVEYYKREGEYSYIVIFPDAAVILKAVSSMPYT